MTVILGDAAFAGGDASTVASNASPYYAVDFDDAAVTDAAPSFGTATVAAQTYTQGTAIAPLTLPRATGGNGAITYALTGLPSGTGLSFAASTRRPARRTRRTGARRRSRAPTPVGDVGTLVWLHQT